MTTSCPETKCINTSELSALLAQHSHTCARRWALICAVGVQSSSRQHVERNVSSTRDPQTVPGVQKTHLPCTWALFLMRAVSGSNGVGRRCSLEEQRVREWQGDN